jgi:hypothetical protein
VLVFRYIIYPANIFLLPKAIRATIYRYDRLSADTVQ